MRVTWSLRARHELRTQRQYIANEQPAAAANIAEHILAATDWLASYPTYGRRAAWDAQGRFRELPVAGTPFIVVYAVDLPNDRIVILRIVHGAQRRRTE